MQLHVDQEAGVGDGLGPVLGGVVGPGDGHLAAQHPGRPAQRLLQEVGGLEHRVGDAGREGVAALDHAVLRERVLDDQLDGRGRADQAGQQLGAAPAGHQAQEALGQGHRGHAGGDGPVGAVEGDLQAAAHRRAVHERERRHLQLAEAAEHLVAQLADPQRLVPLGDRRGALEVGAHREDERLADNAHGRQVAAAGHRVQSLVQRGEASGAERGRLGVVEAVVQRDQGHRARAVRQLHVADDRPGDDLVGEEFLDVRHFLPSQPRFSQMTVPPMPMPTHIVVTPYRTSGRSPNSRASCVISRTPEEASGWPKAIAPP